jgi:hypothetical protein
MQSFSNESKTEGHGLEAAADRAEASLAPAATGKITLDAH